MLYKIFQKIFPERYKQKLKQRLGVPDQESSFIRLKGMGFSPEYILDIGAYEGHWSISMKDIFPEAKIMMIEGQRSKEKVLDKVRQAIPGSALKIALLGSEKKTVNFNIYETASSVLKEHNETGATIEQRSLELLDEVVKDAGFEHADFIKIDTQGYELEILRGGLGTLASAEVVLLEVSFLDIYNNAPLAHDVLSFMKSNGFVLYDICSLMRRPYDKALFQSDFLFVKEDSKWRSSKKWI
jgi:FkbM family methyltransferase